jgi:hypothetical protein
MNTALLAFIFALVTLSTATNMSAFTLWGPKSAAEVYANFVASVFDCDSTAATLELHCRTDLPAEAASKCTEDSGRVTQGPSIHVYEANNTGTPTSIGCTKTRDNANFLCTASSGDPGMRSFTVPAKEQRYYAVSVTAGGEKLDAMRVKETGIPSGIGRIRAGGVGLGFAFLVAALIPWVCVA